MQTSSASFGVVPFENSSNGPVQITLDLLIDRDNDFPDIQACAEAYMEVQHCLVGYASKNSSFDNVKDMRSSFSSGTATPTTDRPFPREPKAKPSTDLRHVQRIFSHPQAFGQCEAFLSTYLKNAERVEVSSTSKAASMIAEDRSRSSTDAAISSRLAAGVNGLTILAKGIQDVDGNTTRFLIIQKGAVNAVNQAMLPEKLQRCNAKRPNKKGLVAFSINHETQGTLADALLIFKKHDLNLTSINSRPSRLRPWHYIFLVEFEGKKQLEEPDLLCAALEDLDGVTEGNKWLGCWLDRFDT